MASGLAVDASVEAVAPGAVLDAHGADATPRVSSGTGAVHDGGQERRLLRAQLAGVSAREAIHAPPICLVTAFSRFHALINAI
jgi:hypothetical protein